jgi:GH24 family phage-related lysozyme (muramidase)
MLRGRITTQLVTRRSASAASCIVARWTAADRSGWESMSRERRLSLLREDARSAARAVEDAVHVPVSQAQFDALVSFVFNVGAGAFRSSALLRKLNAGDHRGAADELLRWNPSGRPGAARTRSAAPS